MSKLWGSLLGLLVLVVLLDLLAAVLRAHAALFVGLAVLVVLILSLIRVPRRHYFGRPY